MNTLVAIVAGIMAAGACYCLMRRNLVRMLIGLVLLSQTVNLVVFSADGLASAKGNAPIVEQGQTAPTPPHADALPQALVLTAIVIGFGLIAFCLALFQRAYGMVGSENVEAFNQTDQ